HLQYNGESTSGLHGAGIAGELIRTRTAALNNRAAQSVLGLWGKPDVAADGNTGIDNRANGVRALHASFDLDRVRTGFFHDLHRRCDSVLRGSLVAAKGQVIDH